MAEAGNIAEWIGQLSNPDSGKRAFAAQELYRAGVALCSLAINEWLRDSDFSALLPSTAAPRQVGSTAAKSLYTVGIAVQPETFRRIRTTSDSPRLAEVPPDQDAMEFELHFGAGVSLDILTSRDPVGAGAIARYLQRFGEGIQQVELSVTDVDRATEILRTRFALSPIYPATRPGADGTRVNFFLAPALENRKVLIELVEPAARR
jgi:hypothetical protein